MWFSFSYVRDIWANARKGVSKDFRGYRIMKDNKMLVIMPTDLYIKKTAASHSEEFSFVVFPRPEHLNRVRKAGELVEPGGPSSHNPEALHTLKVIYSVKPPISRLLDSKPF